MAAPVLGIPRPIPQLRWYRGVHLAGTYRPQSRNPFTALTRAYVSADLAVKQFVMSWRGSTSSWVSQLLLPRTRNDYRAAIGEPDGSALIVAILKWIGRTFPEAPLRVQRIERDGTLVPEPDHELIRLISNPNPFYSGEMLLRATIMDYWLGNAYWIKVRSARNRVVELWWTPSTTMEPAFPDDGSEYITHYTYKPDPYKDALRIDVRDVVHFRNGLDPRNPRKGPDVLFSLAREIFTDHEAANFTAAILSNLGIPGVVLSPDSDAGVGLEQAQAVKQTYQQEFGGDKRGAVMVMQGRTKIDVISWSPEQLNLRDLRRIPEERISAVLGVHPMVVGFGSGLDRSTYSNMGEAHEKTIESTLVPEYRMIASEIERQILPDFADATRYVVDFDTSQMRALQEDENRIVERLGADLAKGAITLAEYRSRRGYDTDESHDIYLRPINVIEVPVRMPPRLVITEAEPPALVSGTRARTQPSFKMSDNERAYLSRLERDHARHAAAFSDGLEGAFRRLGATVIANVRARKAAPVLVSTNGNGHKQEHVPDDEQIADWPAELIAMLNGEPVDILIPENVADTYLTPIYTQHYDAIGATTTETADSLLGIGLEWDELLAGLVLASVAERVAQVELREQTDDAIRRALIAGRDAGDDFEAVTRRIRREVEAGPSSNRRERAERIAATETTVAQAKASATLYQSVGIDTVRIYDGDGCGWTSHTDPDLANGSERSVSEYAQYPLAHPYCVRQAFPVIAGVT